jgi:hypothetical protein
VGPRAVLDVVVKKNPSHRRESNPRTPIVQPVGYLNRIRIFFQDSIISGTSAISISEIRTTGMMVLLIIGK